MNHIPVPSGHDVYWERWVDAFDVSDSDIPDPDPSQHKDEEQFEENEWELAEASQLDVPMELPIRSIMTPFGMLPITDNSMASKQFKFWTGHANFKITSDFYAVIERIDGVETLDILTPYRFRIGVGKLFIDRTVMNDVRNQMVSYIDSKKDQ